MFFEAKNARNARIYKYQILWCNGINIMDKLLAEIYYNPSKGFCGATALLKLARLTLFTIFNLPHQCFFAEFIFVKAQKVPFLNTKCVCK